ncbi:MAG: RT0821/Lpp0805 family surface protein [Alphaproteobacteria bacterium]
MGALSGGDQPVTTGSLQSNVAVPGNIPETLAYSDARVISQVTARAILDAVSAEPLQWTNGQTGSSGTWMALEEPAPSESGFCRLFGATVTSLKGVHRYFGKACRSKNGPVVVESLDSVLDSAS